MPEGAEKTSPEGSFGIYLVRAPTRQRSYIVNPVCVLY
jgi:hypothetical protein